MLHKLVRQDDLLASVDLKGRIGGNVGQRNDGDIRPRTAAQPRDDITLLPPEKGRGRRVADDTGKQHRADVAENFLAHQLIHLGDAAEIQHVNPRGAERLVQLAPDALRHRLLGSHRFQNAADLLLRRPSAAEVLPVRQHLGAMGQDADAHHEKLLEIRLVDPEKLQPLQQRGFGVVRLHQDAAVELQPAQLPVDEAGVRIWNLYLFFL